MRTATVAAVLFVLAAGEYLGVPRSTSEYLGEFAVEETEGNAENVRETRGTPSNSEELRGTPSNSEELRGTPRNSEVPTHPPVHLAEYVSRLERIERLLASDDLAAAQREARELSGREVAGAAVRFHVDERLLHEVASAARADLRLRSRIAATIAELRRAADLPAATPDPELLAEVAAEQDVPELVPGGEVKTTAGAGTLFDRVVDAIGAALRWVGRQIMKLVDWILDLLPLERAGDAQPTAGMRAIVLAVVALIVIAIVILAIEVTRRARGVAPEEVAESAPAASRRDEDPLSRGATEWERYAAQLAAAGRFREAIRAWYHAVLVTCYSAGALTFRKGRTNWEYVASLGPSVPWRGEMIELTRRFEHEWYGADASTPEALDDCSLRARSILEALRRRGAA